MGTVAGNQVFTPPSTDPEEALILTTRVISDTENPDSRTMNATVFRRCPGIDLIVGLENTPVHQVSILTAVLIVPGMSEIPPITCHRSQTGKQARRAERVGYHP